MVKLKSFVTLLAAVLLLAFCAAGLARAEEGNDENTTIRITSDRNIIAGKSFDLRVIVTTNKVLAAGSIDYEHLKSKFQIGNVRFTQEEGEEPGMHVYRWTFPLLTDEAGVTDIESFKFAGLSIDSNPVQILVAKRQGRVYAKQFIRTQLRAPEAIAGQMVMYRVETDILPDVKIQTYNPPHAENAVIELYQEKVISRVSKENLAAQPIYKTQIREYKIIFRNPGVNVIEGPTIQGVIKSAGNKSFFQKGDKQQIEVKPNPENLLVSDNVTIAVKWTPEDREVSVGQAISRDVTFRATDAAVSQLPEVELPPLPDYDVYVEKTNESEKLMKNKKFISTLTVKQVFVPKKNHTTFTVPDQTFTWVNPNNGEKKDAVIKGGTYEVSGFSFNDYIPSDPRKAHWFMAAIVVILVLTVFVYYSIVLYRERAGVYGKLHQYMDHRSYWRTMMKSWSKNDPFQTRNAIIEWAQKRWPNRPIVGLKDVPFYEENKAAFDNLSASCWSPDRGAWSDAEIKKVVSRNRNYQKPRARMGINPYGLNGEIYETVTQQVK